MGKEGEENRNLRRIWNHYLGTVICIVYKQTTVLKL
jgi:hypothetical protein